MSRELTGSYDLPTTLATPRLTWQQELKRAFRSAAPLCQYLGLPPRLAETAHAVAQDFPLFAPYPFVQRMRYGDVSDRLLRQVLPLAAEADASVGYGADPVADLAAQTHPGVIQKYAGRALLIASGVCAIHCRYCFRRYFPYEVTPHAAAQWDAALAKLADDRSVHELILSGGDPLCLTDDQLESLVERIGRIDSVKRLRIHTRLPIVIPQRVTMALRRMLSDSRLNCVIVLHVNHAQEVDTDVAEAVQMLRTSGAWLWNQAVLLRGVNDDLTSLIALSERLLDLQVVPYYLHQLDRVVGAAHFEVPQERGVELMHQLRAALPGYAVPRYVQDRPGEASKYLLA